MNAHAILSAQGWRGHGHSLHKTDDSIGLSKPLYLNRKNNTKGLGVSEHQANDQWWLNAFDEQLKGLETSKKGGVKQTVTNTKLDAVQKGALAKYSVYSSFVSGGLLQGTLDLLDQSATTTSSDSSTSESETGGAKKSKSKDPKKAKETKEERRARKEARRIRKEARAVRRAARQARRERRRAKKAAKSSGSDSSDAIDDEKRRRREKKEEKRKKRKLKE